MLNRRFLTITIIYIIALISIISCGKDRVEPPIKIHNYVGTYLLTDLDWSGVPLDLDEDNVLNNNVLYEFMGLPNYQRAYAEVYEKDGEYIFTFTLPYPIWDYTEHCNDMKSFIFTKTIDISEVNYKHKKGIDIQTSYKCPKNWNSEDKFLLGIKGISLYLPRENKNEFEIIVRCIMPLYRYRDNKDVPRLDHLCYHFTKIEEKKSSETVIN